jgi:myxalamid-type polyketide synthase MxaE and MxaD
MTDPDVRHDELSPEKRALAAVRQMRTKLEHLERERTEPIAIVGMACRFPGGAASPAAFWRLLRDGVDAVSVVPATRWNAGAFYDPDPTTPGKMTTRSGGFLDHIALFDREFFGMSPREVAHMDPQQRLLLEVTWEALDDAGSPACRLAGTRAGIFIGVSTADYFYRDLADVDPYTLTGGAHSMFVGRLSYLLDAHGPSVAVDTACSSSLVAVHMACQSLRSGESTLALAGGVNVILLPQITIGFSKGGFMAPDGRCKAFDAGADGYGRGEGCGVVVLKRLSAALADGDRIWALIRGSAVNHGGRAAGITAPNGPAQQAVIRQALDNAGVTPEQIAYVEAHGTGTPLGDPIELNALIELMGRPAPGAPPCAVGSVKSNIGHLEAAAGVAGLMKLVLALEQEGIPPQIHFRELNPHVSLDGTRLVIPRELLPWAAGGVRRLGAVSSFGFAGTNAHVVVEEAPRPAPDSARAPTRTYLLPLSARTAEGLRQLAADYAAFLGDGSASQLPDVCYTAAVRRAHYGYRLAVVGDSNAAMARGLAEFGREGGRSQAAPAAAPPVRRPKVAFVFSGQGPDLAAAGRELDECEPVFRHALRGCDALFRKLAGWSVLGELVAPKSASRLDDTEIAQPVIFSLEVALVALLRSWGVVPDAVAGHSVGEVAAAHVGGALSLEDAARLVFHRGCTMQPAKDKGQMAVVELAGGEAEEIVGTKGGRLSVAAVNAPRSVVLSGDADALDEVLEELSQRGVSYRRLGLRYAFHSPQVEPAIPAFLEAVAALAPRECAVPFVSTVTGSVFPSALGTDYWGRNMRQPVRLAAAIKTLVEDGYAAFLDIGPGAALTASIGDTVRACGSGAPVLPVLRRNRGERATALKAVAALYGLGYPIEWAGLHPNGGRCTSLPTYPWRRGHYWSRAADSDRCAESTGRAPLRPGPTTEEAIAQTACPATTAPASPMIGGSSMTGNVDCLLQFYSAASRVNDDVRYLHWAPFLEVVPGFSWLEVFLGASANEEHDRLVLAAQERLRELTFRGLDFASMGRVLDIGCGYGSDLLALARRHPHLRLHGYNISPEQIAVAHRRLEAAGVQGRVTLFNRDSAADEFPDRYDLVLSFQVLHHIKDKAAVLGNIGRHLTNGGFFVLSEIVGNGPAPIEDPESTAFFAPKEDWAHHLANNRLRVVECVNASREIANFLHDPTFEARVAQIEASLPEGVKGHVYGPHLLGKLLRKKLTQYLVLRVQKDEYLSRDIIARLNHDRLAAPIGYAAALVGQTVEAEPHPVSTGSDVSPTAPAPEEGLTRARLLAAPPAERLGLLKRYFHEHVATALELSPADLDPEQPLVNLGLDSLTTLELRNRVQGDLEVALPIAAILEGASVAQLAARVLEGVNNPDASGAPGTEAGIGVPEGKERGPAHGEDHQALAENVAQLADEQVDALLRSLLQEETNRTADGGANRDEGGARVEALDTAAK